MIHGNWGLGISQDRVDRLVEDRIEPPVAQRIDGNIEANNPSLCCIALWNLDLHTVKQVWEIMRRLCRRNMFMQIQQVRRICQRRNRKIRFEIVLPRTWQQRAERRLERAKFRFAFSWKTLVRGPRRPRICAPPIMDRQQLDYITLCSLNVNGVKRKIQPIREYMESRDVDTICMQETLRKPNHWRMSLSGFGCVERTSEEKAGRRGLALGVKNKSLTAFPVGTPSSFLMCERVYGSNLTKPFVLGTVYVPHRHVLTDDGNRPLKHEACEILIATVRNLRRKYPNDPIILSGDFNMSSQKVDALALRMLGMIRVIPRGDPQSFRKSSRGGDIDHVLISTEHYDYVRCAWVDRECDISDHWPMLIEFDMKVRGARDVVAPNPLRWQVAKGKALRAEPERHLGLVNDNRFAPLAYDTLDTEAEDFVTSCNAVAMDYGILTESRPVHRRPTTSQHRRAAEKQRRLYIAYAGAKAQRDRVGEQHLHEMYRAQRKVTKRIVRQDERVRWAKKVVKADREFIEDPKTAWAWTSTTAGWRRKGGSLGLQPILNQAGNLCTDPAMIDDGWTAHYAGLARDVIGHSQDPVHWEEVIPDDGSSGPKLTPRHQDALNHPITIDEVIAVLHRLKSWKAAGVDGIPVDFFKIFICSLVRENAAVKALTRVCNHMFERGEVPTVWRVAVVVSIFKKGDPTVTGNYRGISLMDSTLKVLLSILTSRLQSALEANGMVVREQAGFRPREECMAQVMALYEVLRRRFLNKEDTFVLFLDFQKAYDVVPHQALFRRLKVLGVEGKFLVFLKKLYSQSRIAVRRTDGSAGEPFKLERGLRQGCPLSPILFTVFINTIFNGEDNPGCTVPGVPRDKICGLMFADDTVGLAATEEDLLRIKERVCNWSDQNGMTFGVGKCAAMAFKWNDETCLNSDIFADNTKWHINGIPLPTPEEYVYLGIRFNIKLLHEKDDVMQHMVNSQLTKGQQALANLTPFLACASVPQKIKLAVIRCVIQAKMLWGAELWGMSSKRVAKAQTTMNNAMRLVLGVHGPQSLIPVAAMMTELRLQPIWAMVASRRVRAYYKFPTLNTWAATLVRYPPQFAHPERRRTWVTQTEWWLGRIKVPIEEGNEYLTKQREGLNQGAVRKAVIATRSAISQAWLERKVNSNPSFIAYSQAEYKPLLRTANAFPPDFGRGMSLIQQMRCNGYWTGDRINSITPQVTGCVFCNQDVQETSGHLLVECRAWTNLREQYIAADLRKWQRNLRIGDEGLDNEALAKLATIALGGEVNGYSASHYYPREATYSPEEAAKGRVKDPPGREPGPVNYAPIEQGRREDAEAPVEWQWPTGRSPPRPDRVDREASPEWQWPTGTANNSPPGSPVVEEGVDEIIPWAHRVDPRVEVEAIDEGDMVLNRELRREMEWEDEADLARPFWGRCSLFGVAAFLTRVDHIRIARSKELKSADQAEFLDASLGQDGYG